MTKRIRLLAVALLLVAAANMYSMEVDPFPFTDLPKDIQSEIIVIMAHNTIRSLPKKPESLQIAVDTMRELAVSNKALNDIINRSEFTLKLIKNFAKAFHCDEETVAKTLGTRGAQERLELQNDLIAAVSKYKQFSLRTFENLCRKGADLEWVSDGATPLIEAIFANKLAAVKALIKNGADVNHKLEGVRDEDGNLIAGCWTALGMTLNNRTINPTLGMKKEPVSQVLEVIKVLLDAGADPLSACDSRLNNLELNSDRPAVIKAIKNAQAKKAGAAAEE